MKRTGLAIVLTLLFGTIVGTLGAGTAHAAAGDLSLQGSRFLVSVRWTTTAGATGTGNGTALTGDSGYFWFFDAKNVELIVKVLDACAVNQRFWVFSGGLTNVATTLTITDTRNGTVKTYTNPQSTPFKPIQDTGAFTCP